MIQHKIDSLRREFQIKNQQQQKRDTNLILDLFQKPSKDTSSRIQNLKQKLSKIPSNNNLHKNDNNNIQIFDTLFQEEIENFQLSSYRKKDGMNKENYDISNVKRSFLFKDTDDQNNFDLLRRSRRSNSHNLLEKQGYIKHEEVQQQQQILFQQQQYSEFSKFDKHSLNTEKKSFTKDPYAFFANRKGNHINNNNYNQSVQSQQSDEFKLTFGSNNNNFMTFNTNQSEKSENSSRKNHIISTQESMGNNNHKLNNRIVFNSVQFSQKFSTLESEKPRELKSYQLDATKLLINRLNKVAFKEALIKIYQTCQEKYIQEEELYQQQEEIELEHEQEEKKEENLPSFGSPYNLQQNKNNPQNEQNIININKKIPFQDLFPVNNHQHTCSQQQQPFQIQQISEQPFIHRKNGSLDFEIQKDSYQNLETQQEQNQLGQEKRTLRSITPINNQHNPTQFNSFISENDLTTQNILKNNIQIQTLHPNDQQNYPLQSNNTLEFTSIKKEDTQEDSIEKLDIQQKALFQQQIQSQQQQIQNHDIQNLLEDINSFQDLDENLVKQLKLSIVNHTASGNDQNQGNEDQDFFLNKRENPINKSMVYDILRNEYILRKQSDHDKSDHEFLDYLKINRQNLIHQIHNQQQQQQQQQEKQKEKEGNNNFICEYNFEEGFSFELKIGQEISTVEPTAPHGTPSIPQHHHEPNTQQQKMINLLENSFKYFEFAFRLQKIFEKKNLISGFQAFSDNYHNEINLQEKAKQYQLQVSSSNSGSGTKRSIIFENSQNQLENQSLEKIIQNLKRKSLQKCFKKLETHSKQQQLININSIVQKLNNLEKSNLSNGFQALQLYSIKKEQKLQYHKLIIIILQKIEKMIQNRQKMHVFSQLNFENIKNKKTIQKLLTNFDKFQQHNQKKQVFQQLQEKQRESKQIALQKKIQGLFTLQNIIEKKRIIKLSSSFFKIIYTPHQKYIKPDNNNNVLESQIVQKITSENQVQNLQIVNKPTQFSTHNSNIIKPISQNSNANNQNIPISQSQIQPKTQRNEKQTQRDIAKGVQILNRYLLLNYYRSYNLLKQNSKEKEKRMRQMRINAKPSCKYFTEKNTKISQFINSKLQQNNTTNQKF